MKNFFQSLLFAACCAAMISCQPNTPAETIPSAAEIDALWENDHMFQDSTYFLRIKNNSEMRECNTFYNAPGDSCILFRIAEYGYQILTPTEVGGQYLYNPFLFIDMVIIPYDINKENMQGYYSSNNTGAGRLYCGRGDRRSCLYRPSSVDDRDMEYDVEKGRMKVMQIDPEHYAVDLQFSAVYDGQLRFFCLTDTLKYSSN